MFIKVAILKGFFFHLFLLLSLGADGICGGGGRVGSNEYEKYFSWKKCAENHSKAQA